MSFRDGRAVEAAIFAQVVPLRRWYLIRDLNVGERTGTVGGAEVWQGWGGASMRRGEGKGR